MKYADLINFNPIDSVIQLKEANNVEREAELVQSYVMSSGMADKLKYNMLSQLQLDEVLDNKGVLLVGNYGTGKSHLMSLISAIARDESYLSMLQNKKFAEDAKSIAGKFEVLRIEIGASQKPLRDIIFDEVKQDFADRELSIDFPSADQITSHKDLLESMMMVLNKKYQGKGYLIVVDEFLDYLKGKKDREITLDLNFLRELGEAVKTTRLRVIFGVQEQLFGSSRFSFVSESINRVKDRFEQVIIRKEDTAYVVSERILKKTVEQKAAAREHLSKFSNYYSNMAERMEEYVELYPIHPVYIELLSKIYVVENRHILKNISDTIRSKLEEDIDLETPGVISYDNYWSYIKDNPAFRTDANIKEVAEKSEKLEDIVQRSFPKALYKPLAIKIIHALSVYRLVTGDITMKTGLTAENLKDDLCLFIKGMIDQSSDTLKALVEVTLKDIITTVIGQFIDHNKENGQYYLDLAKDLDYDEHINERAETIQDDQLNRSFFDIIYSLMDWTEPEYVANFKIYQHTLNWASHGIFRRGYLFFGTPEDRPTAQPPRDYYVYFLPPYDSTEPGELSNDDEVFFVFKQNEDFTQDLRLFSGAMVLRERADEKNRAIYYGKAEGFRKKIVRYLNENRNTCFEVRYKNRKRQLIEVLGKQYAPQTPFKDTMDLAASLVLEDYFSDRYPEYPKFETRITVKNLAETITAGFGRFEGKKTQLADALLAGFDLLDGDHISIEKSKYAHHYLRMLEALPPQGVLNFSDIYEEESTGSFVDKKFKVDNGLMSLVFLAMVYTGHAVIKTKGKDITASELESLRTVSPLDIFEFKHLAKPQGLPLAELRLFFKTMGLPEGLINNPKQHPEALARLIEKIQEEVSLAAQLINRFKSEFALWGEPLIAEVVAVRYRESLRRFIDTFSSFGSKFNTVPKLQNFHYGKDDIEKFGKDLHLIKIVEEYDHFRHECQADVLYVSHLENLTLGDEIKNRIASAKTKFHEIRDSIPLNMSGESSAQEVTRILGEIKKEYIDAYYEDHQKKRLSLSEGNKKGALLESVELEILDRLKELSIFSSGKVKSIKEDLAAVRVCYELTTDMLQTSHNCQKCHFLMGSDELPAKNRLDSLGLRIDALIGEWTTTLYNALSDPTLKEQMPFLEEAQRQIINKFLESKKLPERVDLFFIEAVRTLLEGFETVRISVSDLAAELDSLGPSSIETVKKRLEEILNKAAQGKDSNKLRIIIER